LDFKNPDTPKFKAFFKKKVEKGGTAFKKAGLSRSKVRR
jgi:hypothetical protein